MKSGYTVLYIKVGLLFFLATSLNVFGYAPKMVPFIHLGELEENSLPKLPELGISDTFDLLYPLNEDPYNPDAPSNPFDLENNSINENIEYDPQTGQYIITNQIGTSTYGTPNFFSSDDFIQMQEEQSISDYWNSLSNSYSGSEGGSGGNNGFGPNVGSWLEGNGKGPSLLKLDEECGFLGCGGIDIRPTGGIDLEFGFQSNRTENPFLANKYVDYKVNHNFYSI